MRFITLLTLVALPAVCPAATLEVTGDHEALPAGGVTAITIDLRREVVFEGVRTSPVSFTPTVRRESC